MNPMASSSPTSNPQVGTFAPSIFDDLAPIAAQPAAHVTQPPQAESKPGWLSKYLPAWLTSDPRTVSLSQSDRNLASRLVGAIEKLPSDARDQIERLKTESFKDILGIRVPDGFGEFICMLNDVVVMVLLDDPMVAFLMQPRLVIQYGVAYTAVIDGLAIFARQFLKRMRAPEDQGDKDLPALTDESKPIKPEDSDEYSVTALLNALYSYTVGQIPTTIPKAVVLTLVGYNTAFALARNLEHFGMYILKMVKYAVDAIWRLVTGHPYFSQEQQIALDEVLACLANIDCYLSLKRHDIKAIMGMNALSRRTEIAIGVALARGVEKEITDRATTALNRLNSVIAVVAPSAYMEAEANVPVIAGLVGKPGIGKSLLIKVICAALSKLERDQFELADMLVLRQNNVNFQPALPKAPKYLWIDDPFLITSSELYTQFLEYLGNLGSGIPKLLDAARVEEKGRMWEKYAYIFTTDNILPAKLPATDNSPLARRYTGTITSVRLNDEYASDKRLVLEKITVALESGKIADVIADLNRCWAFVDHSGTTRNFSEYVSMLYKVRVASSERSKSVVALISNVGKGFQLVDTPITPPPVKWGSWVHDVPGMFAEQEEAAAASDPKGKGKPISVNLIPKYFEGIIPKQDSVGRITADGAREMFAHAKKLNIEAFKKEFEEIPDEETELQIFIDILKAMLELHLTTEAQTYANAVLNSFQIKLASMKSTTDQGNPQYQSFVSNPYTAPVYDLTQYKNRKGWIGLRGASEIYRRELDIYSAEFAAINDRAPTDSERLIISIRILSGIHDLPLNATGKDFAMSTCSEVYRALNMGIEDQGITIRTTAVDAKRVLSNPGFTAEENHSFARRFVAFADADPKKYEITSAGVSVDGKSVNIQEYHDKFVKTSAPKKVDYCIPIRDWTPDHILHLNDIKFHAKGHCVRHGAFCYNHGTDICEAYDSDALEVTSGGLAVFVIANPQIENHFQSYFTLLAATRPAHVASPWMTRLAWFAEVITASVTGFAIGFLLTKLALYYLRPEDQAYGHSFAKRTPAGKRELKRPKLPSEVSAQPVKVVDQAKGDISTFNWILRKLDPAIIPVRTYTATNSITCQMHIIIGNLAVLPSHMFPEGTQRIDIGGLIAQRLPVIYVPKVSELTRGPYVQVIRNPGFDNVFVVLPTSIINVKANLKYMMGDDANLSSLTGVIMAARTIMEPAYDDAGNLVPQVLDPLREFAIGDTDDMRKYTTSGAYTGLYIKSAVHTSAAMCGYPCYTTNTLFGRGHQILVGDHRAYAKDGSFVIVCPLTHELVEEFINLAPKGTLSLVEAQSMPTNLLPTTHFVRENITLIGELPNSETQHQSSRNDIKPSILHDVLTGLIITDPVTGELVQIPPPDVMPSPVWDHHTALKKVKSINFIPTPEAQALFDDAVEATALRVEKYADPRLLEPQDALFTIEQAMNGVPELGIPGLDMKKSPGYMPGHKTGNLGRTYWATETPNGWVPKPVMALVVNGFVRKIMKGKIPRVFVVTHTKPELRAVVHRCPLCNIETGDFAQHVDHIGEFHNSNNLTIDGLVNDMLANPDFYADLDDADVKYARLTNAYPFPLTVAVRMFAMAIPQMFISGRVANGMSFGADLSSHDGAEVLASFEDKEFIDDEDASNYDASKSSYYSEPMEERVARWIVRRFPFVTYEAGIACARLNRCAFIVIGKYVYLQYHGMLSGFLLTTPLNCGDSSSTGRYCLMRVGSVADFDRDVASLAYGDDLIMGHNEPKLTVPAFIKHAAELGVTYTVGSKLKGEVPDHSPVNTAQHLKRRIFRDISGYVHAPLTVKTIAHIHAFIHAKDRAVPAATTLNAEAALREWFHYGRGTFNLIKERLNAALIRGGCSPVTLMYDTLRAEWHNRFGGAPMTHYGAVEDQAAVHVNQNGDVTKSGMLTSPDGDTQSAVTVNPASVTSTTTDSGIVTQKKLVKHVDASAVFTSMLPPAVKLSSITRLNPYPKQGVEEFCMKEYPLETFDWLYADAIGTRYRSMAFPEVLLLNASISAKLARFRFMRAGVRLSFRINGGEFAGGALLVTFIPFSSASTGDVWRHHYELCVNSLGWTLSAGKPDAVVIPLPFSAPTEWYDMVNASPTAAIGTVLIDVHAILQFMSSAPPPSLRVTVYAQFFDLQLSGNNTNAGPAVMRANEARSIKAAIAKPSKQLGTPVDQSSASEGVNKAISGVITGVATATKTVDAIISGAESIAGAFTPLLGLLDKPIDMQSTVSIQAVDNVDMLHTEGTFNGQMLSQPVSSLVSINNGLMSEAQPKPTYLSIMRLPGLIDRFLISKTAVTGDLLYARLIHATTARKFVDGVSHTTWVPTPMGYIVAQHKFWHGDINMLIRCFAPQSQKCSIRITLLPSTALSTGISDSDTGDLETYIYDIVGDTDIPLRLVYNSPHMSKISAAPGEVIGQFTEFTQVVIQVVSEIAGQIAPATADISCLVYLAAASNMVVSCPNGLWTGYFYDTVPVITDRPRKLGDARKITQPTDPSPNIYDQACVRDLFAKDFEPISQSKLIFHSGIVDPDQCRGPCEAFRRFQAPVLLTMPILTFSGFGLDDGTWRVIAWKMWSGSQWNKYHFLDGDCLILARNNLWATTEASYQGGAQIIDLKKTRVGEWGTPYQTIWPAREILDSHTEGSDASVSLSIEAVPSSGTAPTNVLYSYAMGDDFCLYHFVAPPFWIQTTASPSSSAAELKRGNGRY